MYNVCRGLYLVSKQRKFRLRAIAEYLSRQSYDIVALQECWMRQDFEYIKNRVEAQLPYAKYFLRYTHTYKYDRCMVVRG